MSDLRAEDYEALAEFRYNLRRFLRFSKDYLGVVRLTPEQYETLLAIKAHKACNQFTISQLSERLQVKHHTAVSIVSRLVEQRLITRAIGKTDRRQRHVALTAKGEKLIKKLAGAHRKELRTRSPEMIRQIKRLGK
jgi:DNA-binding MarR family transcriptional regulator